MTKILVCDDEKDIVSALKIYLSAEGYEVLEAYDGRRALEMLETDDEIRLVLMDIMMPEMDGITALSRLRKTSRVPVILLTAKSEDSDKILGLNVGADDYVTKPFNPVEVTARVKSQLRRYLQFGAQSAGEAKDRYTVGAITLDDRSKEVELYGEKVPFTPTEFDILKLFMQNPGKVLSPKEIYRAVWKEAPYGAESTVAVHIRHIREKIEVDPAEPRFLKVVWAQGYKLEPSER